MNVKDHHFSIRLRVSSQTTDKQKCSVAFLHSRLFTLGVFVTNHLHIQDHLNSNHFFRSIFPDSQYTVPAFQPIFFNYFAKFGLEYAGQSFLDFVNDLLITFEELASQVTLKVRNNQKSQRLRSGLFAECTITSVLCKT